MFFRTVRDSFRRTDWFFPGGKVWLIGAKCRVSPQPISAKPQAAVAFVFGGILITGLPGSFIHLLPGDTPRYVSRLPVTHYESLAAADYLTFT